MGLDCFTLNIFNLIVLLYKVVSFMSLRYEIEFRIQKIFKIFKKALIFILTKNYQIEVDTK
jgi:hypothetical protein